MNELAYRRRGSRNSALAIVSLVFGVLSWCLLPMVGAVVAVVCGHLARSEIRHAPPDDAIEGGGMALAGLVLGYLNLLAVVVIMMIFFGALFLGAGLFGRWW